MNSLAAFLTGPLAERFGWALLHFVWEGAAIAALLAVALRALRRRPAAALPGRVVRAGGHGRRDPADRLVCNAIAGPQCDGGG